MGGAEAQRGGLAYGPAPPARVRPREFAEDTSRAGSGWPGQAWSGAANLHAHHPKQAE